MRKPIGGFNFYNFRKLVNLYINGIQEPKNRENQLRNVLQPIFSTLQPKKAKNEINRKNKLKYLNRLRKFIFTSSNNLQSKPTDFCSVFRLWISPKHQIGFFSSGIPLALARSILVDNVLRITGTLEIGRYPVNYQVPARFVRFLGWSNIFSPFFLRPLWMACSIYNT